MLKLKRGCQALTSLEGEQHLDAAEHGIAGDRRDSQRPQPGVDFRSGDVENGAGEFRSEPVQAALELEQVALADLVLPFGRQAEQRGFASTRSAGQSYESPSIAVALERNDKLASRGAKEVVIDGDGWMAALRSGPGGGQ